jgi:hypothetical protein
MAGQPIGTENGMRAVDGHEKIARRGGNSSHRLGDLGAKVVERIATTLQRQRAEGVAVQEIGAFQVAKAVAQPRRGQVHGVA